MELFGCGRDHTKLEVERLTQRMVLDFYLEEEMVELSSGFPANYVKVCPPSLPPSFVSRETHSPPSLPPSLSPSLPPSLGPNTEALMNDSTRRLTFPSLSFSLSSSLPSIPSLAGP